jgi:hypothetical protein
LEIFLVGFVGFVVGRDRLDEGNGDTLTALTVFPFDDELLSVETIRDCDDRETVAGRIVLELSSDTLPADIFGGDNFRGDDFFGDNGGSGGIAGTEGMELVEGVELADASCGDRKVNPPSKSLSQSSSSLVSGSLSRRFDRRR